MIIRVEGDIEQDSSVDISCCGQTKVVDALDRSIEFDIPDTENLVLKIEENKSKSNHSIWRILIFIITSVIQGLFNILLMNSDSKWYQNIRAYNTKVLIPINENNDLSIKFRLYCSKYIGTGSIWEVPRFSLEPQRCFDIIYEKNPLGISNAFFNYLKKVISVSLINLLIFTMLLVFTYEYSLVSKYILTALIVILVFITLGIIFKEYKRYKKLLNAFIAKE